MLQRVDRNKIFLQHENLLHEEMISIRATEKMLPAIYILLGIIGHVRYVSRRKGGIWV